MKKLVVVLFVAFLLWMAVGGYLLFVNHEKAPVVMGLGVFFMSFVLMPVFIFYRYKDGKYKKYIINDQKIKEWRE